MELSVSLTSEIFKYDPVARKVREQIYKNNLDPLMSYFIEHWYGKAINANVTLTRTSGGGASTAAGVYGYGNESGNTYQGSPGDNSRGIVVGTGTGALSFSDYSLGSIIAHGTGAGQLYYYQGTLISYQYTSAPKKYQNCFQRVLGNFSGASITVNEMGYYLYLNTTYIFMLSRDVIGGGVSLANNGYYLFQFTLEIGP